MQKIVFIVVLVISMHSLNAQEHTLNIIAEGFKSSKGVAIIRVFNQKKGFPKNEDLAFKVIKCKIVNNKCDTCISLPTGHYAIAIIHDENNNNELDKNWAGMPVESIGLSNFDKLGKPSFDKSKLIINKDAALQIKMQSMF